jgi:antitoxin component of RelBE/YafQ-DinJ toxin-antitoxin module
VKRGRPKSPDPLVAVLSVRLRPDVYEALYRRARAAGLDLSEAVRAVLSLAAQGKIRL